MRRFLLLAAVLCLVAARGADAGGSGPAAFAVGETLRYRAFWGPLLVGEATLSVRGLEKVDGHLCYHFEGTARTAGIGRLLYPVDSRTESWWDQEAGCTRRFRQERREGSTRRNDLTTFDYVTGVAVTSNVVNGKTKRTVLPGPVQDMLSCLYYVRQRPLALDREERFQLHAGRDVWNVMVRPDQRRVFELRPVGTVPALRIEPEPTLKIVASNKGRMWLWLTDDERHLPLTLTSTMVIGSAKLVLYAVEVPEPTGADGSAVITTTQ